MSKRNRARVAVVGGGPGGLAAAMLLAADGYDVTVYEKQEVVGGRSGELRLGDYRFDRGATFLMMPHLLEELFASAGRSLKEYVDMKELDPLYSLHFGDTVFTPSTDQERTAEEIEKLFPGNGSGYKRFMAEEQDKLDRVIPLLQRPFQSVGDYVKKDVLHALPKLHATDTVYNRLSKYFDDERLRFAFAFQAKYLGMSPWECPGTFTILSFMEHRYGLYHPIGGINRVLTAMAKVISEYSGIVHTSCGVKRVLVQNGQACGLLLENGEKVEADYVVLGADFGSAMTQLFEPGILKRYSPDKISRKRYSCSTAMLYLGVDGAVDLAHHSVHFADDYRLNVEEITRLGKLSADASIYVHNPSVLDSTLAPAGKSSLYVLMPVPNLTADIDWEQKGELVKQDMMDRLQRISGLENLPQRIEESLFFSPLDWRNKQNVYNGATFNLAHNLGQMMYMRPHNTFEEVKGIWLVGGGTHPGSGLPTIFESAKISVALLKEQDRAARSKVVSTGFAGTGASL
ncbi:phytoene desaturase family protein [Paenibacillus sp. FSL R7-0048]|jgi:phytoene desaturase|uniref:phytoene desaturase family protein n=1 Tax=Paenibacillus TaxID=44249 RepID=UPI00096D0D67|nr:phytoene desaturase family protein [Paenibacillus odorifer]OMD62699.1 phytoene desaturase [Paenibacillus odorifer]